MIVDDGAYFCLLGPSGCGKTTILRMIAGHESPTEGRVLIGGRNVVGLPPVEHGTAMMFQSYALFPHRSVLDNVAFALKMRGVAKSTRHAKARELLEKVRLEGFAQRLPSELSGGQQQRVALARALITNPRVLLLHEPLSALDEYLRLQMRVALARALITNPRVLLLHEPLSALDEYLRLQMRGELRRMQRELGITFVHVTHTQLEAIGVADTVVVMEQGRIEQMASARDIFVAPRTAYVARFMGGQNVISGTVERVSESRALAVTGAGARLEIPLGGMRVAVGEPVSAAVRRDRVAVRRPGSGEKRHDPINSVDGEVHAIENQGSWVKITIDLGAGQEFVANVAENDYFADPIVLGERAVASWPPGDVRLLEDGRAASPAAPVRAPAVAA